MEDIQEEGATNRFKSLILNFSPSSQRKAQGMFTCFIWVALLVYHSTCERARITNEPRLWNFPSI